MKNKKAMSAVVTTVILIALVLIALGVVWAVISNLIQERSGDVDVQSRCLDVDVRVVNAQDAGATGDACDSTNGCMVTIRRGSGGSEIGGVNLVFTDGTQYSEPVPVAGNIQPLGSATHVVNADDLDFNPTQVETTAYIIAADGSSVFCQQKTTFNIN